MGRVARAICALGLAGALSACALPRLEQEPWLEARTAHFTLIGDLERDSLDELAHDLEVFRSVVLRVTNVRNVEPRVPTRIYAFKSGRAYARFAPSGTAGYFSHALDGNYMVLDSSGRIGATHVLKHEYTHFLLRNAGSYHYPLWYNEGLAEFLSTVQIEDDLVMIGLMPEWRASALTNGFRLSTDTLLGAESTQGWGVRRSHIFYGHAWLLTHFLHAGHAKGYPNRNAALVQYLQRVNDGSDPSQACVDAFGLTPSELAREADEYLPRNGGTLPYVTLSASGFAVASAAEMRTMAPAQIAFAIGELALRQSHANAEEMFRRTLELDPRHARATMGLAIALSSQRKSGVEEAIRRALELGPNDSWVQLKAGSFRTGGVAANIATLPDAERVRWLGEARTHFEKSIELEPEHPAAWAGLGSTWLYDPGDPAEGIAALETARDLVGSNDMVSLPLADLYIRDGRYGEARRLLEDVLHWSHGGPTSERAQELLRKLDTAESEQSRAVPSS